MGVARIRLSFSLLLVFTLAVALPARADDIVQVDPLDPQPTAENGVETDESATSWFVELAAPSTSDGGTAATVATSHDAFKNAAQARGVNYAQRFEYGDLWNGFAVDASGADVSALRGLAGVKSLWPVATVSLPGPEAGDGETIDLATAIQMTGADYVQNRLGITGKNVKVAIIDTGIDYDNPDLGGCFGPSCRVFTGWDFVGDAFNADPVARSVVHIFVPEYGPSRCWAGFSADFPDQLLVTMIRANGFWMQLFVDPTKGLDQTSIRNGPDYTTSATGTLVGTTLSNVITASLGK